MERQNNFLGERCMLCPRECGANRTIEKGFCGEGDKMRVAKIMLHMFEEPIISGTRGSGAVFFSGCNLRCGYCQNGAIANSRAAARELSPEELAAEMLELEREGAHNINLVTAAHFVPAVASALSVARKTMRIPVVYNSSGYEKVESLRLLDGLVDVYLPDFKYFDDDIAQKYSNACGYREVATSAIREMLRQVGEVELKDGLIARGVVVRHLVLPSQRHDSMRVLERIAEIMPRGYVSVMSQYTPVFNCTGDASLDRRVTSFEYNSVVNRAVELGLVGFMQNRNSALAAYTPNFTE